jgi:enamine deaminase RidA (YjgF/YER057c/UK114 family)
VIIAGTTSADGNGVVIGRTPYEQAVEIFTKLGHELGRVGGRVEDVLQTRMYVTDISRADEVGRAHGEFFGAVRPVTTMVEVSSLIDPRMLVEVELMAQLAGAA